MDPHLLRTFVAVAEHGSFSAAAALLGYTQSAVSQQIAALESDLGTPLLHRRPVGPTAAGERLLEHAGPILLRLEAARAEVARAARGPAPRLAVGASPLAAVGATQPLRILCRSLPGVALAVHVLGREAVITGVATGALDLGIVDGVVAPSDPLRLPDVAPLTAAAVSEQPLAVVLPVGHPLARRRGLALADLADAGWIDAPDAAIPLPDLRMAVGYDGLPVSLRYQGTDVATLVALVAAGHGLAVLPGSGRVGPPGGLTALAATGVTAVPVTTPRLVHRVECVHGTLSGPADTLAELLRPPS